MTEPPNTRRQVDGTPELDLLPCPFCASTNVGYYEHVYAKQFAVACNLCGAEGPGRPSPDEAGRMWSRRVSA
jgi:hypothetical protein